MHRHRRPLQGSREHCWGSGQAHRPTCFQKPLPRSLGQPEALVRKSAARRQHVAEDRDSRAACRSPGQARVPASAGPRVAAYTCAD